MLEMERYKDELAEQLDKLKIENSGLQSKRLLLEACVRFKDWRERVRKVASSVSK